MKTCFYSLLPLMLLLFSGCSSSENTPQPTPTPGTRGADEYDIKISYSHYHLNHQVGLDGQYGFNLGAVAQLAAGEPWAHTISIDEHARGETITFSPRTSRKGYTFPVSLAFTNIKATNNPLEVTADASVTATVSIDGKVVETLMLDKNAGYIDWQSPANPGMQRVKGVTATIDLSRY